MSKRIEELLAMLDLPEEQYIAELLQLGAIASDEYDNVEAGRIKADILLAGIAFRLRDEVACVPDYKGSTSKALVMIFEKRTQIKGETPTIEIWWIWNAKPIEWIIATLIARELAK